MAKKPFIRNAPSRSSERDRPLVSDNSESQTEPKHTTPSVFGSIKRVHVSKISGASELKSSAHFREKKKNGKFLLNNSLDPATTLLYLVLFLSVNKALIDDM